MLRLRFENSNEFIVYVQIDPFAGVYALKKRESIEIEADGEVEWPQLTIDDCGATRVLTLYDYDGYFVIRNGERIPWTEFTTNIAES